MKKLIHLLIPFILLIQSCTEDELQVTLIQNGNLTVTLIDDNGNFLPDGEVTLFQGGSELASLTSDASGIVNFGTLNVGTYILVTEIILNGLEYEFSVGAQVSSGVTRNIDINPQDFDGTVEVVFRDNSDGNLIEVDGLNLLLVRRDVSIFSGAPVASILAEATAQATTASNGTAVFLDIPAADYYLVYHNNDIVLTWISVFVEKDETIVETFFVNELALIFDSKPSWNVSSVVSANTGNAITTTYSSISFNTFDNEVTLRRTGGLSDIEGFFSFSSSSIFFSWDSVLSSWSGDIETISFDRISFRYFDNDLGETVTMTLQ